MDSDDDICTPPDILELATKVIHNLLPEKSRKLYEKEYNNFLAWKIEKETTSFSENVILAYLKDLSDKFKPSSMWAKYSILKSTLSIYNNIDITKYSKVIAFLKRSSEGHKEKKSLTFTSGQIKMFLEDSPDILYLFEKIINMGSLRAFLILQLIYMSACNDRLKVVYEWNLLDYDFPTAEARQQALDNRDYIPKNNLPLGLEVYEDRLFITVPRWEDGVVASISYIDLKDNSTKSPKLKPYPTWEAHSLKSGRPEIVSPYRVRADKCGRLWVLDSGRVPYENDVVYKYPPTLIIYDLKTDKQIRSYEFPPDQVEPKSSEFGNIAVEENDCHNSYAYTADSGKAGIVIYSWEKNDSWRFTHPYFFTDPLARDFEVNGNTFSWDDGILGLALSSRNADNYSSLYFHPIPSFNEYIVSTEYLRNQTMAENNLEAFKLLGSRGPKTQSLTSFLDQKSGVLIYSLIHINGVGCWHTSNKEYNMENQGIVLLNNETMIFPSDIKIDQNSNVWVMSDKLPIWINGKMDPNEINFRVFSAPVSEAISNTVCDIAPKSDI